MKTITRLLPVILVASVLFIGCSKNADLNNDSQLLNESETAMIAAAGFRTEGAVREGNGYLVEGDIFVTADELRQMNNNGGHELIVANAEHYRTTNLVTGLPRNITIRYTGAYTSISTAINNAISRYNARNLRVTFTRITSGTGNITVSDISGVSYIASAGFPSGGNPYNSIRFNTAYTGWNANTLTSVMAHEIGHCIGFRHTDYMDRSYSCGGSYYNEGSAGVGAIHIPGTPTGPSASSWMLACIGNGTNRPFTTSDNTALDYVY